MALSEGELTQLAGAVAVAVPEDLLAVVVIRQRRVTNLEALRKTANDPARGRLHGLARAILDVYAAEDAAHELLLELYRRVDWSPDFSTAVAPYAIAPDVPKDMREALHRRRDHFISSPKLTQLTREFEPRICCIVGEYLDAGKVQPIGGTGFLVAPSLILTAAHVFEPAVKAMGKDAVRQHCAVYFDYVAAPLIDRWSDRRNDVRRVELAADWLLTHSPSFLDDGKVAVRDDDDNLKQTLVSHLDFALVKLSEPVGLETVDCAGGRRRGWISLPNGQGNLLGIDSYVNIAQHPDGLPRQIGFGRYQSPCPSNSRFWYDTETDKGSSGAPCLTRDLELVGMHNAAYAPKRFNQAIAIDLIVSEVRTAVKAALEEGRDGAAVPSPPIWNLAEANAPPRMVLGRVALLNWLDQATLESVAKRSSRLYAAVDLTQQSGSGKTFSLEILRRVLATLPGHKLVAFGTETEALPPTVEDMVRVLGDHLGVSPSKLADMPKRPQVDLPTDAPDGDKLRRWASETVPRWFVKALEEVRPPRRDARQKALAEVAELKVRGEAVPPKLQTVAGSAEPIWIEDGWRVGWIALDGLTQARLPGELRDLLAALTGVSGEEAATPPVLRRLRWLFLGYRPDFIRQGDVVVDLLDPAAVGSSEAATPLMHAWASRAQVLPKATLDTFTGLFDETARIIDMDALPAKRLDRLQRLLGAMVTHLLPKGGCG